MLTVDTIKQELLGIIQGVRNPPAVLNFLPVLPYTRGRFDSLIERCIKLHKEVTALPDGAETWEASQRFFDIESEYKRLRARLMLAPSVFFIYIAFFGLWFGLRFLDITGFVRTTLKVEAPERLITFGIAGAFLYLSTSVLTSLNQTGKARDQITKIADFTIRVLLAIIVPIVLVALFFTQDGQLGDVKVSPEILAFACGYSAQLVIEIFNKIVQKGSKMIEAL